MVFAVGFGHSKKGNEISKDYETMNKHKNYNPPFTPSIIRHIAEISEAVGRLSAHAEMERDLRLMRINRIRTIYGSLAIEGNTMSEAQVTAVLDGKKVLAKPREVQEVKNAIAAYDNLEKWRPEKRKDLLEAHKIIMKGLIDEVGVWRSGGVGVMAGLDVIHVAPPASRVADLMNDLLKWLKKTDQHPLVSSLVFHYEFEFIHPFSDGNGRIGRLWQTLILTRWNPIFSNIPVESLVHENQAEYYPVLQDSTEKSYSAPFIEFMLRMISNAALSVTPQVAPQVTPQVMRLVNELTGEMTRDEIQILLGLKDRKSFRERYLLPALSQGFIEMTIPEKPNSRLQKYRLTERGKILSGCKRAIF